MRSSQLEILRSLGYPIYARTSLLAYHAKLGEATKVKRRATVAEVRARAEVLAQQSQAVKQSSDTKEQEVVWPRFSIGLVASDRALVVFDCPESDTALHRALVENMLRKCGCNLKELPFAHFRWPVVENPRVTQGEREATQALTAMQTRLQDSENLWAVVAGDRSKRIFSVELFAERVIYLPASTAQMIDKPGLRKQAWEALAALREHSAQD